MDEEHSFRYVEKQIECAVKEGTLSSREAYRILNDARKNYRSKNLQRLMDKRNEDFR